MPALEPHPSAAEHVACGPNDFDDSAQRTSALRQPRLRPELALLRLRPILVLLHRFVPSERATLRVMSKDATCALNEASSPSIVGRRDSEPRAADSKMATTPAPAPARALETEQSSCARRRLSLQAAHRRRAIDTGSLKTNPARTKNQPSPAGPCQGQDRIQDSWVDTFWPNDNTQRRPNDVWAERRNHPARQDRSRGRIEFRTAGSIRSPRTTTPQDGRTTFRPNEENALQRGRVDTSIGPHACLSLLVRRER